MEEILAQIVEKISSYNIVNNLYPGILFVYVLKIMFGTNLLSNNWFENLIVFYFVGMVLSRIGSIIIEPAMSPAAASAWTMKFISGKGSASWGWAGASGITGRTPTSTPKKRCGAVPGNSGSRPTGRAASTCC